MTETKREKLEKNVSRYGSFTSRLAPAVFSLMACAALPLSAGTGQLVANTAPKYVSSAQNLGSADPTATIEVSIWLNLHNRSELDTLAAQLYDPSSPSYRHWLKPADLLAKFAPSAAEAAAVQKFFVSHNLAVVAVGPGNYFVRARGTVGDVQKAFQVQLNNFNVRGTTYRAPTSDPYVDGPAAGLVSAVYGLDSGFMTHPLVQHPNAFVGSPSSPKAETTSNPPGFFTSNCFTGVQTEAFNTNGTFPKAVFKGNTYYGNASNPTPGCGYTPAELYTAYSLTGLYAEGFNGAGQTITIIDWCGSPTVQSDANAFSQMFGLPTLDSSNFSILNIPTVSTCSAPNIEINLDVEWAHAIAPGANIDLVVPPTNSFQDIDEAFSYIVVYGLGNVISGSYGSAESEVSSTILANESLISEMAAVSGISANFSSGDAGDFSADGISATVSDPADSPYATAVGGVTVALNSDNGIAWQTGWGNNQVLVTDEGVFAPPLAFGFSGGAGGGPSGVFSKPSFQSGLPGTMRQLPDISWVADPFTGVVVAITEPGVYPPVEFVAVGGTSVACPMFSALWAIANQEAGFALGQAASYVYSMPAGTITDVTPVGSSTNVNGAISTSSGSPTLYTASQLLGGATQGKFYSVLTQDPYAVGATYVVSFGTDCTAVLDGFGTLCTDPGALKTTIGWDNVTGMGTPNGQAFADSFKP